MMSTQPPEPWDTLAQ